MNFGTYKNHLTAQQITKNAIIVKVTERRKLYLNKTRTKTSSSHVFTKPVAWTTAKPNILITHKHTNTDKQPKQKSSIFYDPKTMPSQQFLATR